ncbi:hypothetical protein GCM10009665_31030 [Kitasatospora nipponensis]|uniref:Peptidase M48-like protein n=1 Tax=Kitasatospora nipponensis TaxID=258049 RepID=A0ABN1W7G8_9ACTN
MLLAAKPPVRRAEREWIERSMAWLVAEFGPGPLLRDPVLPTAEFFPGPYDGSEQDIRRLVGRLCKFTGVHPEVVTVEIDPDDGEWAMAAGLGFTSRSHYAAGHYRRRQGLAVIGVDARLGTRPTALVAVVAHELGHVRLLDEVRVSAERPDHEPLTDLLTVYFGLGVFSANAALSTEVAGGRRTTRRLGYLSEREYGYGLACYAWLRGESRAGPWERHLTTNPRAYLKQGLRYLRRHAPGPELTAARALVHGRPSDRGR